MICDWCWFGGGTRDKDGRSYVSHSPQPYSKFKLQPTKNSLMVYGQNGKPAGVNDQPLYSISGGPAGPNKDTPDSRTLNAPPTILSGRNANGYPISPFDKQNSLSKNSQKNIERYQKGSFVQHGTGGRRTKAHSNNGAGHALKVNQSGIMIGLPKVNKPGENHDRGGEFSPAMAKSGHGYSMLNSHQ